MSSVSRVTFLELSGKASDHQIPNHYFQNGSNEAFAEFVKNVDYLLVHMAGNGNSTGRIASLHAKPSVWGQMAAASNAGHIIVSHIATLNQNLLDEIFSIIAANYGGPFTVASDLMCVYVS